MRTPKLSDREKRSLARGWSKRKVKLRRAFDKRGSYLGNRIYELTGRIDITAQHIKRIETALGEQKVEQLLAPPPPPPVEDGEGASEGPEALPVGARVMKGWDVSSGGNR